MLFQKKEPSQAVGVEVGLPLSEAERALLMQTLPQGETAVPRFYQNDPGLFSDRPGTTACISHQTVFKGDVETVDSIEIFGRLEGNLSGSANVRLSGAVQGELRCRSLQVAGGTATGHIFATGSVTVEQGSSVRGNIFCEQAQISGEVLGNIEATQGICLTPEAKVKGDLLGAEIELQKGASLNGAVQMKQAVVSSKVEEEPPQYLPTSLEDKEQEAIAYQG